MIPTNAEILDFLRERYGSLAAMQEAISFRRFQAGWRGPEGGYFGAAQALYDEQKQKQARGEPA